MTNTLLHRGPSVYGDLLARVSAASRDLRPVETPPAEPVRVRGAGYVYLSTSPEMPGIVQVASSINDPRALTWALESFTGLTRFQTVFAVRTKECTALIAAMQRALSADRIPHQPDLYKLSLRFARQMLLDEAAPFRPADEAKPRRKSRRRLWAWAAAVAAAAALFGVPRHGAAPSGSSSANAPALPTYHTHAPQLRM